MNWLRRLRPSNDPEQAANGQRVSLLLYVYLAFFVVSLLTNILGALIPDIIQGFSLSLTAAGLLPFAFFIAYGVLSIPAGLLTEAIGDKRVACASFLVSLAGSFWFAARPGYVNATASLFLIGAGMAMLQVVLNPLLRVAGGAENYALHQTIAQVVFGAASFLSPRLYSALVTSLQEEQKGPVFEALSRLVPPSLPWLSLYWLFTLANAAMLAVTLLCRFPRVTRTAEEAVGSLPAYRALLRKPLVFVYFVSIFFYVGSEQGAANWISEFLRRYHGCDPQTTGAYAVSWFWGLMTAGCLVGMLLLKLFDSRWVLVGTAVGSLVSVSAALFGPTKMALLGFPAIGFFASLIWPITFALALNSVKESHGAFAGILCTAIAGGAVVPLMIGRLGDYFGLREGMCLLYFTFGWSIGVGLWAKPMVTNKTFQWRRSRVPGAPSRPVS